MADLRACCIPWRELDRQVEVLLVTSRWHGDWIFPKGGIEYGETAEQAAAREAEEEAGVVGVVERALGRFPTRTPGRDLEVFTLRVTEQLKRWPEWSQRKRKWASPKRARELITRGTFLDILARF